MSDLIERLRGRYPMGNGDPPEFGYRQFDVSAIQQEAADEIECLLAANRDLQLHFDVAREDADTYRQERDDVIGNYQRVASELAEVTADRNMARRSLDELQQRWAENAPAARYKRELDEANLVSASWKREAELNELAANESAGYARELAEARAALDRYGQHDGPSCEEACNKWIQSGGDYFVSDHRKCTCGLDDLLTRTDQPDAVQCEWMQDVDGDWSTGCGRLWCLMDGTPADNDMTYCHHCGKRIKEQLYLDPDDDGIEADKSTG